MNELISIIVPIYNVEKYLPECIESILNQTYRYLEVILIDDGSTDQSGKMCDNYAEQDSRVKVIHQKNGGAANAKNAGLKTATGKYLAFVDGDDYLELDALFYMIDLLEKRNADVVQACFRKIYRDRQSDVCDVGQIQELSAENYIKRYTTDWTCGLLWDKLYKRKLYDNIFFEEGHRIDDEFFTYQGIIRAQKVIKCPKVLYNYRQRKSSVMYTESFQQRIVLDKLDYLNKRRRKIISAFPELAQTFNEHYLNMLLILSKDPYSTIQSIKEIKQLLDEYFHERNNCQIPWGLKFGLWKLRYSSMNKLLKSVAHDQRTFSAEDYFE